MKSSHGCVAHSPGCATGAAEMSHRQSIKRPIQSPQPAMTTSCAKGTRSVQRLFWNHRPSEHGQGDHRPTNGDRLHGAGSRSGVRHTLQAPPSERGLTRIEPAARSPPGGERFRLTPRRYIWAAGSDGPRSRARREPIRRRRGAPCGPPRCPPGPRGAPRRRSPRC